MRGAEIARHKTIYGLGVLNPLPGSAAPVGARIGRQKTI
ncbi:hypothetical protein P3T39_006863 [Kitasatospora sp. GP82]|nr:hypothetical protein [Kitasatospora sp. GP82]